MNERWYSISVEEAEKILKTNVSSGLDKREAERRRRRGEGGSVFSDVRRSVFSHAAVVATDITVIIFALASLISAFLDDGKRAGLALALALVSFAAAIIGYVLSRRVFESSAELSLPRARVIRGGRTYAVKCDNVVTGDILLLEKGDVVPCDCRLISAVDLRAVEFVGKIGGKEKRELNEKDASFICRPDVKPNVSAQKNMLVASSIIVTGNARAVAVRTGRRTFLSLLLGEIDIIPRHKKEMKMLTELSRLLSKINLAVLISVVPFTVIAMITGRNQLGILDVLLSMLALSVTTGSEIISGLCYMFPSLAMKKSEGIKNGARIKYPDAIQELNYLDSVLVIGNRAVCDDKKYVENVFASNNFYDAASAKNGSNQALNCFLDLALLGMSHYLSAGVGSLFSGSEDAVLCAEAVSSFADSCGISREVLEEKYSRVEFSPAGVSGYDTTLIKCGEEYRVICVSDKESLLGLCMYIRTPDGAVPLDDDKKSDIIRACEQLKKKARGVTLIASRISPIARLERLGLVQNQLVFEGYIVYSDPYIDTLSARIEEMKEADITFYYAAEESAQSVITAFNIGAVKGKHEIAYASAFERSGKRITDDLGQYRAYLGFDESELESLAKAIRGEDGTLAVIATDTEHLSVLNRSSVAVAVSDENKGTDALVTLDGCSEIIRKNSDMLIPSARKDSGGFEAFSRAVLLSKNACSGLYKFLRYFAFSCALRLALTLLPLFFGKMLLGAVQIVFLGALVDIPAMLCLALGRHTCSFGDKIEDIETFLTSPLKKLAKYIISGAALGFVILLLASVFGSSGSIGSEHLSVFAFASAVLSQIFTLIIIARPRENDKTVRIFLGALVSAVLLIFVLALAFARIGDFLGVSYPGWQVCSAAVLISVIGYVIVLVTDRYT